MGTILCHVKDSVVCIVSGALFVQNEHAENEKNHDNCVYLEVNSYRCTCPIIMKFVLITLLIYKFMVVKFGTCGFHGCFTMGRQTCQNV